LQGLTKDYAKKLRKAIDTESNADILDDSHWAVNRLKTQPLRVFEEKARGMGFCRFLGVRMKNLNLAMPM
jgi:hypothetical protein